MHERLKDLRLLWVTNTPAPYRLELFELIHGQFASFHVVFMSPEERGRHWVTRPLLPFSTTYLTPKTMRLGGRTFQLNTELSRLVAEQKPSLVIAGGFSPSIVGLVKHCKKLGIPWLLLNDGTIDSDPVRGAEVVYRRWLAKDAGGCIAASSGGRAYFLRLGVPSERISTVQLTRDLVGLAKAVQSPGRRESAKARWGLQGRVMTYIGQLVERKRPMDALRAYELTLRTQPDLKLAIAGDGEQEGALHAEVSRLGLEGARFLGHLTHGELVDLLAATDVGVFPSNREPYGMVVIEALAAGVPVVSTPRVGAAVDLVRSGENGWLVPPGSPRSIAEAVQRIMRGGLNDTETISREVVTKYDVRIVAGHLVRAMEKASNLAGTEHERPTSALKPAKSSEEGAGRLVVLTRILAPYRVPLYWGLKSRGVPAGVVVCGSEPDAITAACSREFPEDLPIRWCAGFSPMREDVRKALSAFRPGGVIVEHGARLGFTWTTILRRSRSGPPLIIWTHGIENRERFTGRSSPSGRARWVQLDLADGILCYDHEMRDVLRKRYPGKAIGVAPNSTDGSEIIRECGADPAAGRESAKRTAGLKRGQYVAVLGRMIRGKRPHMALEILERVRLMVPDVGLIMIGDGPERDRFVAEARSRGLSEGDDFVLTGEVWSPRELARWLHCADIHLNAGYAGLNVVDALFAGLPTVLAPPSPKGPFHSPEWRYLQDGPGGLFADVDDAPSLADRVVDFLDSPEATRREIQGACARFASARLGIEPMVDGFIQLASELGLAWPGVTCGPRGTVSLGSDGAEMEMRA